MHPKTLQPVMQEFKEMVDKDTRLSLLFKLMFEQVRDCSSPFQNELMKTPTRFPQIRNI